MDSRPGLYDSVLVLDYKSLYPSIIRTFLIDPVGLVEGMAQPDPEHSTEGFLDAWFSREKHCLPEIVTNIWHGRDEAKRQGNKPLSQALKIIMNAFMVCSAPPPAVSSIHAWHRRSPCVAIRSCGKPKR